MKRKVGTYHFHRNHRGWGIWQVESVSEDGSSTSNKVESCATAEQAYRRVYELNGWGEPKHIPDWIAKQK